MSSQEKEAPEDFDVNEKKDNDYEFYDDCDGLHFHDGSDDDFDELILFDHSDDNFNY